MTEQDILNLIREDEWMMNVLKTAQSLNLPDWMIGAGFVRNKVWDFLQKSKTRHIGEDVDLVYFDSLDTNEETEKKYEAALRNKFDANWSVKNQARMHVINGDKPYGSSEHAIAHWPETPTCIAVFLEEKNNLKLVAPHGIDDLIHLQARPSPLVKHERYMQRMNKKNWKSMWPDLIIEDLN